MDKNDGTFCKQQIRNVFCLSSTFAKTRALLLLLILGFLPSGKIFKNKMIVETAHGHS